MVVPCECSSREQGGACRLEVLRGDVVQDSFGDSVCGPQIRHFVRENSGSVAAVLQRQLIRQSDRLYARNRLHRFDHASLHCGHFVGAVNAILGNLAAGRRVREVLRRAELVMASDLVLIECDRVLIRAVKLGEIDESTAADRRAHLNAAAAHWHLCRLSLDIVDRARRPFPSEPVRTVDAIHLASALAVRSTVPSVELLSLDDRIRRASEQLGFRLQPR